ncbi:MAG: AI-2E family transporter [Clostridia bacterium]|nr:AI-2E family transporter [Clostridia bacterium]
MWIKELRKYLGIFVIGAVLIAVYKTFDSFDKILDWIAWFSSVISPFVIGAFIAYILAIPCRKIEGWLNKSGVAFFKNHQRGIAVTAIYLIFFAVVALLLVALLPSLVKSIRQFMEQLPALIQGAVEWFNSLGFYTIDQRTIQALLNSDFFSLDRILVGFNFDNVNRYAKGVMNFGSSLFDLFIALIVSAYLLADRAVLKKGFEDVIHAFVPQKHSSRLGGYAATINEFIIKYISCQLVEAILVFVLSFLALTIMQIEYAPLLALMVGSFNLIPYFGAIVATTLTGLITVFTKSFPSALIAVAILIAIQQFDANFIQPKLLSNSLNIRPVWVIVGVVLGGAMFGILGIFLAVPVLALLKSILWEMIDSREKQRKAS